MEHKVMLQVIQFRKYERMIGDDYCSIVNINDCCKSVAARQPFL